MQGNTCEASHARVRRDTPSGLTRHYDRWQPLQPMSSDGIQERLRRIEERIEALEKSRPPAARPAPPAAQQAAVEPAQFDLSLLGRTLIVFGGAYLLRAITESGVMPIPAGVGAGLVYALSWSIVALRPSVSRVSAAHHAVTTTFIALPLIFEATRRFRVLDGWSSVLALSVTTAILLVLAWRREIEGVAWTFTLAVLAFVPVLMTVTSEIVPYVVYLTALGVAALWLGYVAEWHLLRWAVALELDAALLLLTGLIVSGRLAAVPSVAAIGTLWFAFAAYLASFAVRTLVRDREVIAFEIAQTLALLVAGSGGAMWIAASRSAMEIPLAALMLSLAAASYAIAFWFIPRHSGRPANFVFYSSLGLMLVVAGGAFITRGLANSIFWAALALICTWLASTFRKASLAMHASVYLLSGLVGAGMIDLGLRALFFRIGSGWPVPSFGAFVLLAASAGAAALRPIERQGTYELWHAAKLMLLAQLGWMIAALGMTGLGPALLDGPQPPAEAVAVARTALLGALTMLTAWASRFAALAPARVLGDAFLAILVVKLMAEDFRLGSAATLFLSLAIVGLVLIVTSRLRHASAVLLAPAGPPAPP